MSLRRLLCLYALLPCLTGERGSNALFVRLATMLCPWSGGAMRCLCAWRLCSVRGAREQCGVCAPDGHALTGEQGSNALSVRLGTMPDRGAGKQCAVCAPGDHVLSVERGSNAMFVRLTAMPDRGERRGRKPAPLALFARLATMPDRGAGSNALFVCHGHALPGSEGTMRCLSA